MLSKCANPACLARFHYLHEGRIFKVELGVVSDGNKTSTRRIEHFWLCERCVQIFTVVVQNGVVSTRPLHLKLAEGAPQDKSQTRRDVA